MSTTTQVVILVGYFMVVMAIALGRPAISDRTGRYWFFRWPNRRILRFRLHTRRPFLGFWAYDPHDPSLYEHAPDCDGRCGA